jgi:hypothetical protein
VNIILVSSDLVVQFSFDSVFLYMIWCWFIHYFGFIWFTGTVQFWQFVPLYGLVLVYTLFRLHLIYWHSSVLTVCSSIWSGAGLYIISASSDLLVQFSFDSLFLYMIWCWFIHYFGFVWFTGTVQFWQFVPLYDLVLVYTLFRLIPAYFRHAFYFLVE